MGIIAIILVVIVIFLGGALADSVERVLFYKAILKDHLPVCGQEVKENPKYWASEGMLCFSPPSAVCTLRNGQFICK